MKNVSWHRKCCSTFQIIYDKPYSFFYILKYKNFRIRRSGEKPERGDCDPNFSDSELPIRKKKFSADFMSNSQMCVVAHVTPLAVTWEPVSFWKRLNRIDMSRELCEDTLMWSSQFSTVFSNSYVITWMVFWFRLFVNFKRNKYKKKKWVHQHYP